MDNLATLDWIVIVGFLVLIVGVGLSFTQKAGKNLSSFFLGGRNLPWYIAGISMVATTFAADTPLAVTELVAQDGISGNWMWWNFLAGGMLTTFFFANLWRRAEVMTEVELIELRYSGKPAACLRGFRAIYLGLFMNVVIIGWVNLALMTLLEGFFNIPPDIGIWYCAGGMGLVALYSSLSGLIGIAITDAIQFVIAMIGCILLAFFVVQSEEIGGMTGLIEQTPQWSRNFFPTIGDVSSAESLVIGFGSFVAYFAFVWWASWYPGAEPGGGGYVAQRMMSTKDEKHAIYATLFFQIAHYCIRPWPWIIVALAAMVLYPDLENVRLGYVYAMRDFLPAGLKGLLLVAFFAAYMSTISTQLNWGASYLINDVYVRFMNPKSSDKVQVNTARLTTILLSIIGLIVASQMDSIKGAWGFIIECGAGLGLVLILRWYWWRINAWSEITATIAPFVAFAVGKYALNLEFPNSFFLTVGFTTVAWITVTFLTPPTDRVHLTKFYNKIKPDGVWGTYKAMSNQPSRKSQLGNLFMCWFSAIVMTYSILFLMGKLIFMEWQASMMLAGLALVSFFVLNFFLRRTRILSD